MYYLVGVYKLFRGISTGSYILGYKIALRKEHNKALKKELKRAWKAHKK